MPIRRVRDEEEEFADVSGRSGADWRGYEPWEAVPPGPPPWLREPTAPAWSREYAGSPGYGQMPPSDQGPLPYPRRAQPGEAYWGPEGRWDARDRPAAPTFGAPPYGAHRERPRGRAPKGFRREDARIREDICDRLVREGVADASDVEVAVENGHVRLSGSVPHRRDKFVIEDACLDVFGVADVQNAVRVHPKEHDVASPRGERRREGIAGNR
jgi:hypothetical protein